MSKNTFFNTRFWQDSFTSDLDPVEKLLFIYFITSPYLSLTGIYEIPLKFVAMETGLDKEMVIKILDRFEEKKKVMYRDGWLCVLNYPKYQSFKGGKLEVALKREIKAVPKDILELFIKEGYPIDTLSIQHMDMDKVMDKEIEEISVKTPPLYKSKKYLSSIPDEDMSVFLNRFDVGEKQIKDKAESFLLYCDSKGKKYANYKSALLNAMKKDFVERTEANKRKPVTRVKTDANGSPVVINGAVQMETV